MSRIDDIEALSRTVSASTINVLPRRCSKVRNVNSKCRVCDLACPHDALLHSVGRLGIDEAACTDCGACAAACPTSSFATTAPTPADIVRLAREAAPAYGGIACFMCERDAEGLGADRSRIVVLPCLSYLDEYLMVGLVSCGIERVALLRRGCEGCSIGGDAPYFETAVASARQLLKTWRVDAKIKVFAEVPDNLILGKKAARKAATSKRDALTEAGGSLMGYAARAVDEALGKKPAPKTDRQIVLRPEDVEPADTYRSLRMLRMLDKVGTRPRGTAVESRFWGMVAIDDAACQRCGACSRMCVTDALHYEQDEAETPRKQIYMPGTLTFRPSLCMGCGLCKDSCVRKALTFTPRVKADDLDADVVYTYYADEPPRRSNPFGM